MSQRQGVHAGPNGPRFVFGRENLDYQGPDLSSQIQGKDIDPKSDFQHTTRYGEKGTLSVEEEDLRRVDLSRGLLEYILNEGYSIDDYRSLEGDEREDLIADFLEYEADAVPDDYDRIKDEFGKHEFERGLHDMFEQERKYSGGLFSDDYVRENEYSDPNKVTRMIIGNDSSKMMYLDRVAEGDQGGSYEDYLNSGLFQVDDGILWESEREMLGELVTDWNQIRADEGDETDYAVIEGRGIGWRGLSGSKVVSFEELDENPSDVIAPNTSDYSQDWMINKDGNIEVIQSHHDAPTGESYTIRPLRPDEYYKDSIGEVYAIPQSKEELDSLRDYDADAIVEYLGEEGERDLKILRELVEKQQGSDTLSKSLRDLARYNCDENMEPEDIDGFLEEFKKGKYDDFIRMSDATYDYMFEKEQERERENDYDPDPRRAYQEYAADFLDD